MCVHTHTLAISTWNVDVTNLNFSWEVTFFAVVVLQVISFLTLIQVVFFHLNQPIVSSNWNVRSEMRKLILFFYLDSRINLLEMIICTPWKFCLRCCAQSLESWQVPRRRRRRRHGHHQDLFVQLRRWSRASSWALFGLEVIICTTLEFISCTPWKLYPWSLAVFSMRRFL